MKTKTGRDSYNYYKRVIVFSFIFFKIFGKKNNFILLRFFRNVNGRLGLLLRYVFLMNCSKQIGDNVSIHPGVFIFNVHNLEIGSNVSIHPMCYLEADGGLKIGSNVSIAHGCSILTTNHQWEDKELPIKYNKIIKKEVIIHDDVWLGCGVRILAGSEINTRSIVAAGAVVTQSIKSNEIHGGIPAKLIKRI